MTATVQHNQSLLDIAVQHCGTFEAAFDAALLNGISLTDDINIGNKIKMPLPDNKEVADYYAVNDLHPASAITQDQILEILNTDEGIEFWRIEYDFIIQ